MAFGTVNCSYCGKKYLKDNRHINENKKLNRKSYCSKDCQRLSQSKLIELICENPTCGKKLYRAPHDMSPRNFCSHSCAATITNTGQCRVNRKLGKCIECGVEILRKDHKYCSIQCYKNSRKKYWGNYKPLHTIDTVLDTIREFVKNNKRLPVKKELNQIYHPARKYFKTWNGAVEAAGFSPNPVMFAHHQVANDGHICDSIAEQIIDDYLYEKGITHERSVPYPEGTYTADFKVGDRYIEYFGLFGEHKRYDELRVIKKKIAKKYNINLLEIYPHDLYSKHVDLSKILQL